MSAVIPAIADVVAEESVVRKLVGRSQMIVRSALVDYTKEPEQLLHIPDRVAYVKRELVPTLPRPGSGVRRVNVYFFKMKRFSLSMRLVELAYRWHGLVSDPYAQVQVNIDDPRFAKKYQNATQWGLDSSGCASYLYFGRNGYEDNFDCNRSRDNWIGGWWWFAGTQPHVRQP